VPRAPVDSRLYDPLGPYSHAVRVGNQLFVSGTAGVDPATGKLAGDSAYDQAGQAIRNVLALVEAAGGGERDVVSVTVNLVNMNDFPEMNRAYAELFSKPYPARTVIGVSSVPKAGALLTINLTAVLGK
jgi:2-iminobutanoate/2-iminopropanoate deaminase